MNVFMTGASGWIGSAAVPELLAAGHRVSGLARSDSSAAALRAAGVDPVPGDLDDLAALRAAAERADAVIHLGNKHDWSDQAATNRTERLAVETFVAALVGTGKPLLLASGTAIPVGRPLTEDDPNPASGPLAPRGGTESLALSQVGEGVHAVALRFAPTVHGAGDHGFVAQLVRTARERGVSGYVGDGQNRWTAVDRGDAGRLVALALDGAPSGFRAHAVAETITTLSIATAIGTALGLPVASIDPDQAGQHFGWLGAFFAMDLPASSDRTRAVLGWAPTGPGLLDDLAAGGYTR